MPIWFDKNKSRQMGFTTIGGGAVQVPTFPVEPGGNTTFYNGFYYQVSKWYLLNKIMMVRRTRLSDFAQDFDTEPFDHHVIHQAQPGQLGYLNADEGINWPAYMYRFPSFPGHWYLYFIGMVDFTGGGARIGCLESDTDDPMGTWTYKGRVGPDSFALGFVPFEWGGDLYMVTSTGRPAPDSHALSIQQMYGPTALVNNSWNVLTDVDYAWERNLAGINEPDSVVVHNNKLHVIFSASHAGSIDYCVGRVTYNGSGNILSKSSWVKQTTPILQRSATIYKPGQAWVTKGPDNEDYLGYAYIPKAVYDATVNGPLGPWPRSATFKKITWDASNNPIIGPVRELGETFPEPPHVPVPPVTNNITWAYPTTNPASVTAPFSASFTMTNNATTSRVELWVNDPVVGSIEHARTTAPDYYGWSVTSTLGAGTYSLFGRAVLTDGSIVQTIARTVTVTVPAPPSGIPAKPTNIVNGGANMGPFITSQIANRQSGETFKLSTSQYGRGVYMLDLTTGTNRYCILMKSGVTFDFSDCELRLRGNQTRTVQPNTNTTCAQWADIITNTGPLNNARIVLGCLNGQSFLQQAAGGGRESWMDGIALKNSHNCIIEGGFGPWSTGRRGDGTYAYLGEIKNIMANDGGGGCGEGFFYTFDGGSGGQITPCIARRFKIHIDDASVRSATGGSSNSSSYILHEDIRSRGSRAQGMTSWKGNYITYRRVNSSHCQSSAFRNEYGGGHRNEDCYAHHFGNNAYNIKGPSGTYGTTCGDTSMPGPIVTITNFLADEAGGPGNRRGNNIIQQNSLTKSIVVQGRYVDPPGSLLSNADNLCNQKPSVTRSLPGGASGMQLIAPGSYTPPLPD